MDSGPHFAAHDASPLRDRAHGARAVVALACGTAPVKRRCSAPSSTVEQRATGRVLEHDPASGRTRVLVQGLAFANGVALRQDEQTLFVAETGKYRVWRVDLAGRALDIAQASPLGRRVLDNLPGYPDNLSRGEHGRIWPGLSGRRSPAVDAMAGHPGLRALTLRLPRALWPVPKPYGHMLADPQDPASSCPQTTDVTETADRLYIQNLHRPVLGWKLR